MNTVYFHGVSSRKECRFQEELMVYRLTLYLWKRNTKIISNIVYLFNVYEYNIHIIYINDIY